MKKTLLFIVAVLPLVAFGAESAKTKKTTETNKDTLSVFSGSGLSKNSLKGLSILAAYDFADSIDLKGANDLETEKALVLGAHYEFEQFYPGLAAQVGGTYELEKTVENTGGIKYQIWTTFAEMTGKLTPKFKLVGGVNYTFPSLSGANDASIKGKMGYQFGASFQATENFAIDARMRRVQMDYTAPDEFGGRSKTGLRSEGVLISGRYVF